jgi:hypothetical protein
MRRGTVSIALAALLCLGVPLLAAAEGELDPLLEILIEQGVITREQGVAVEAERARRAAVARQAAPTAVEETAVPPPAPAAPEGTGVAGQPGPPAGPQATARVVPAPSAPTEVASAWYDRIDFKGDLRLRYESFFVDGLGPNDQRHRFRMRLRTGMYTDVTERMKVGFQLRSGDPLDPVSDNQSADGGFTMKPIAIAEAYAGLQAASWLDVTLGKFSPTKIWDVTDMQWDDDVTVEGAMQDLTLGPLKVDVYQFLLEESGSGDDAYMLGGQVYADLASDSLGKFIVGAGYEDWVRPQLVANSTLNGDLHGNKVTNFLDPDDQLISDFNVFTAFARWSWSKNKRWPVKVHLAGYYNSGAAGIGEDYNRGYFARIQVGDYKHRFQPMFRYTRYYSEPDALFYVFTQSDTLRASDLDGHRVDFRLGMVKKSYFNFTWYHTKPVYAVSPTMDRFQLDYIIDF